MSFYLPDIQYGLLTQQAFFSFILLDSHAFIFMLSCNYHYVLSRLTNYFLKKKKPQKPPYASWRKKSTCIQSHRLVLWCIFQTVKTLLFSNLLFICIQFVVNQKCFQYVVGEGEGDSGGREVCLFIYLCFESKVCLFIKHEPWCLKMSHRKSSP